MKENDVFHVNTSSSTSEIEGYKHYYLNKAKVKYKCKVCELDNSENH